MKILITAGPTREPLDPVRFLSNYSTGEMGFALARRALARRHEVLLVLGPVCAQPPVGADVHPVETTGEMLDAALALLPQADAIFCAAAVADYRPAHLSETKRKRGTMSTIELVENPDIAAEMGARRGERPLVVFALETDNGVAHAQTKLLKKNGDLCVLNGIEAIGAAEAAFTLIDRDGGARDLGTRTKDDLADLLLDELNL